MTQTSTKKSTYEIAQPLLLSLMVVVGIFLGYKMNDKADGALLADVSEQHGSAASIGTIDEVIKLVESRYLESVDQNALTDGAIEHLLSQLDPHSIYIPPSYVEEVVTKMNGTYYGLGIETINIRDTFHVIKVLNSTPASRSGIKMGDQIIKVNGNLVAGVKARKEEVLSLNDTTAQNYTIMLRRGASKELVTVTTKLELINIQTADEHQMINQNTGYIKINQFSAKTYEEFMKSLEALTQSGLLRNLVIDLRDNPGGYLPQATKILNQLILEKGNLLFYTKNKANTRRDFNSNGKAFFDIPNIAVLVNEGSASGSELIAGSLQDWDRAVIIGRRTFGKGLVQEQFNLSNGGAIRLTTARYYLPSGRNIQREYKNNEGYENDIEFRLRDSSLFVDKRIKVDSTNSKFRSKLMGRYLLANAGIEPDIFIPADATSYQADFNSFRELALTYVYEELRQNPNFTIEVQDEKVVVRKFLKYLASQNKRAYKQLFADDYNKSLFNVLQVSLQHLKATNDSSLVSSADLYIISALNYFEKPNLYDWVNKK